jgi:translocation and assembly module TamB
MLHTKSFSVEGRSFDSLDIDAEASETGVAVRSGALARGTMLAQFSARVGLKNWRALPNQPLSVQTTIRNGDLADVLALAGQPSQDYSGALTANVQVNGTVGDPTGTADLLVAKGTLKSEPFDRIQAQMKLAHQLITISSATLDAGASHVVLNADFQHPQESLTTGRLHVHVQTNQVNLAQIQNLQQRRPNTAGVLELNSDVTANVEPSKYSLADVTGNLSARGLQFEGTGYGDVNLTARTSAQTVEYQLTSNFAGSNIRVTGNTRLTRDYPTTADGDIRGLPVERVLVAIRRMDIPAKGNLSGKVHFTGTMDNPEGDVDVDLANAVLYQEPLDHLRAKASYRAQSIDVEQLEAAAGPSRIDLTAKFAHPRGNLNAGTLQFHVNSANVDLARIRNVQMLRPGAGGRIQMAADISAEIRGSEPRVLLGDVKANLAAAQIVADGKNYGDLTLNADTAGGKVNFTLASNLAGASIQGRGNTQLSGDYPVDAQLGFNNLAWASLEGLVQGQRGEQNFDVAADGHVAIQGPILKPDDLRGSVEISRLEMTAKLKNAAATSAKPKPGPPQVTLKNDGPISASLDRQTLRINQARITGPQTDFQARGSVSLKDRMLNLTLNSNANLAVIESFDRDVSSSGNIVLATTVRGTFSDPVVNGTLQIRNASFISTALPNGIANANGQVVFNGSSVSISDLTAESGGGKVTIRGSGVLTGNRRFGLSLNGSGVRVRLEEGVSLVADANLNLTGTPGGSALSGTVTIEKVAYAPQTDLASILVRASPPVQATAPSIFDTMKLDVQVQTSDALAVQTSLAQSLQGQANLRVRGTASHPGAVGRVTLTEGKLTFFGATYTVNSGSLAFYNPSRVEPIADLSLETSTKGVDVTLRATGPIDNLKLTYTSDPPLQFQEIVSLLATGKTPVSDPTLLANQPSQAPETYQQMGESAIMSRAIADPVANRLQRVFGVSQLKIDPTFSSGSDLPHAQLTLQQHVTNNVTFTYVSALDNANAQTIRVEVALNPQWAAAATRDQNGIFSINLLYKAQIR